MDCIAPLKEKKTLTLRSVFLCFFEWTALLGRLSIFLHSDYIPDT